MTSWPTPCATTRNRTRATSQGPQRASELESAGSAPRGTVFFHAQDVEPAVLGRGLYLAFGSLENLEGELHDRASVAIASEAVACLSEHGVATKWSGSVRSRIEIPPFAWQKRKHTRNPLL